MLQRQTLHLFIQFINVLFDQPRLPAQAAAVIDEEFCFAQINHRPDVIAREAFGNLPLLFENVDFALCIDLADEMHASGRQRQLFRYLCDLTTQ